MNLRLKELREDNDFTQRQIADLLHYSQATYSKYENEQHNIPIFVLIKLANFYGVTIDYLLGIED